MCMCACVYVCVCARARVCVWGYRYGDSDDDSYIYRRDQDKVTRASKCMAAAVAAAALVEGTYGVPRVLNVVVHPPYVAVLCRLSVVDCQARRPDVVWPRARVQHRPVIMMSHRNVRTSA